jgi:hypothetical protein
MAGNSLPAMLDFFPRTNRLDCATKPTGNNKTDERETLPDLALTVMQQPALIFAFEPTACLGVLAKGKMSS